jgi:hypothetical protein
MSNEVLFNVVFKGKHSRDIDKEKAILHFSKLFKMPVQKATLFFDGKPRTLKKSQTLDKASHFRAALKKAGIRVSLVKIINENYKAELTMSAPGVVIVNQPDIAPVHIDTSDLSMDEVGIELVHKPEFIPADIDTSELEVAEVGAQFAEKPHVDEPQYDVANITIEEVGAIFAEKQHIPEPDLDISELTMDEVGVTLVEKKKIPKPVINTDDIKLIDED